MNKERLELMHTMLCEVAAGEWKPTVLVAPYEERITGAVAFNMGLWAAPVDCGFSACAVGHAIMDERFAEQGLSYAGACGFGPALLGEDGLATRVSWDAVTEFFDIGATDAHYLFDNYSYRQGGATTAHVVAERVRKFIDDGGWMHV